MPLRVVWKCWKDCKSTWGSNRSDLNGLVQCSCSAPWRNPEAKMPRDSGLADFQANFVNASTRETKRIWSDIVSANALRDEEETEQAGEHAQLRLLDGPSEEQVDNEHAQDMFVDERAELEHAQDMRVDEGSQPLADPPPLHSRQAACQGANAVTVVSHSVHEPHEGARNQFPSWYCWLLGCCTSEI